MLFSRNATRLLAVAVSASAALTMAVAEPASAAGPATAMTVSVNAPEFPAGVVDVTVTIVADPTLKPTQAVVQFGYDATSSRTPLLQTLPIAAGTCDVTCTLTASFDTLAWTRPEPLLPDPNVYDRQALVTATVSDGVTAGVTGSTMVWVGNHRPRIHGISGVSIGLVGTDQVLRASIGTLDSFGVDPVTRTLWWVPGHTDAVPPVDVTATDTPGTWHLATSLAALPSGRYLLRVVAFNAAGAASEPFDQWFTVDHGPVVSVDFPAAATMLPTDATQAATPTITVTAAADPSVWVTGVTVLLDGATIVGGFTGASHFEPVYPVWLNAARLPAGSHTLTFRATDTRGLNTSVSFPVQVDTGAVVNASISGDLVYGGTRPTLTSSFQAYPGTTLASWTMEIDATPAGSGVFCTTAPCPAQASTVLGWPAGEGFTAVGRHTVNVHATDSVGVTTSQLLVVWSLTGTSTTLATMPASARYGTTLAFSATTRNSLNFPLAGATAQLQWLPTGATRWTTLKTATTTTLGTTRFTLAATRTASYRVVVPAKAGAWGASVSATRRTTVTATVSILRPVGTIRVGRRSTFTVHTAPYEVGVRVTVQVRLGSGAWVTRGSWTPMSNGTAFVPLTFWRAGAWSVRAIRPASIRVAAGATSALAVRVY